MKAAVAAAILLAFLFGVTVAEAGWYPTKRLPKPLDWPMVRPKVKEAHKAMNRMKHPPSPR